MDTKERIEEIRLGIKKHTVSDALILTMIDNIGHKDAVLRDEVVYMGFVQIIFENKLSATQMKSILQELVDRNLLLYEIDEAQGDGVFTRAFTSLLLVLLLEKHYEEAYLSETEETWIINAALNYMMLEKDNRGLVDGKGWAHAFAHGADLIGTIAKSKYYTNEHAQTSLQIMKRAFIEIDDFLYNEEGRFSKASLFIIQSKKISYEEMTGWITNTSHELLDNDLFNICWERYLLTLLHTLKTEKIEDTELNGAIENYIEAHYKKFGSL